MTISTIPWPIMEIKWGIYSHSMNAWLSISQGGIHFANEFTTQAAAESFIDTHIGNTSRKSQKLEVRPKKSFGQK